MEIVQMVGFTQHQYRSPINLSWKTYEVNSPAHYGQYRHAVDLIVPDPRIKPVDLFAPSEGRVIGLKQDQSTWGNHYSFSQYTNYLTVQTPWGEFWELCHIGKNSCDLVFGAEVKEGQKVAQTGMNGWITETDGEPDFHVHFMVGVWVLNRPGLFKSLKIRHK